MELCVAHPSLPPMYVIMPKISSNRFALGRIFFFNWGYLSERLHKAFTSIKKFVVVPLHETACFGPNIEELGLVKPILEQQ